MKTFPSQPNRTNSTSLFGRYPAPLRCLLTGLIVLLIIFAAGPATAFAQSIIYVNDDAPGANNGSSWADAYTSLQDALGAAGSGDQIWVAEGIYIPVTPADPGNVTPGEREATFQLVNGVEIYGGFAGGVGEDKLSDRNVETNLTILSGDIDGNDATFDPEMNSDGDPATPTQTDHIVGDNSFHVVTGSNTNATARLDGFTITAGNANDNGYNALGGGMVNYDGSPTLTGVTFSGNGAEHGGGMDNYFGSPTLTGVTFSGNQASLRGGGMHNNGPSKLTNVTFTGNQADDGGGMVNLNNSDPTLTGVTFSGNEADRGGGMFNYYGSPTLTGVTFSGNQAIEGGGMFNYVDSPTLTNVTFSGNRAAELGGGMFIAGDPTLINVFITGNSADTNGGGIYNSYGHGELVNVTIAGNSPNAMVVADGFGDGFTSWRNTIVYGGVDGDNFIASNSLIEGNSSTANGNIDATGLAAADIFSDPGGDDYSLLASSPAINAGSNQAYINAGGDPDNDTDLAGSPRLQYGTIDMGAYEFQGDPETPIILTMDEGWRMLSSPIDGLTYSQMLKPVWTQGVDGADYSGEDPNVYIWNIGYSGDCIEEYNNNQECDGWQVPSSTDFEGAIPAGTGFLVYVFTDDDYDGDPEEFEKNLTLTGANHSGEISPPMNTIPEGWTLVGNPYRLPVAFSELERTDVNDAAYVYDPNATDIDPAGPINGNGGAWRSTVDETYGDITDGAIAPGQGFFVQTASNAGTPSLTFSEADRTGGGEFYGKQKQPRDFVRLEVRGESLYNSAWIRFSSEGSLERTTGEALELQPLSTHYAMMGARKADGTLMDIAHYPLKTQELEIPLAVEATRSGTFTITTTDLDLPAGMSLYLYDKKTSESMRITDTSFEYSFTIDKQTIENSSPSADGGAQRGASLNEILAAGAIGPSKAKTTGKDRFVLTTTPGAPGSELPDAVALGQNYPNPFNPSTVISYQLPAVSQVRLEVYDMLGRRVATLVDGQVAAGVHQVNFDASRLSSGVYLYRLSAHGPNGTNQIFTKKLTLIK